MTQSINKAIGGPQTAPDRKPVPVLKMGDFTGEGTEENTFKNVFFPNWDNQPEPLPAVLSLGSTPILTHQNSAALIANPGAGKSSAMEAICASYLNPDSDNLGFTVDPSCKGIINIDNERTNVDVWNSFYRMARRAGISPGTPINNIKMAGLRSVARLAERVATIESLLQNNPCSLLLLDGAGDLVTDTNDLGQAIECRIWMRELTVKYDIAIFSTLHPNPNSCKPRGHQGSEICREAESVLLARSQDGDTKIITTDFEHGKNRNNPKLTVAYTWSDEFKMFVSADVDELASNKQASKQQAVKRQLEDLANAVLGNFNALSYTDLVSAICEFTAQSEPTSKRRIKEMLLDGLIKKHADGKHRLNIQNV